MSEYNWEQIEADLDRLTDEALWDIVRKSTKILRERRKDDYPKILTTPFKPFPGGIGATELIIDEAIK